MALSGYGFAGKGLGKAEPVKSKRLTPVTATLTILCSGSGYLSPDIPSGHKDQNVTVVSLKDALHDNRNKKQVSGVGYVKKVPGHKAPFASRKQPAAHRDGRQREDKGR